MSTRKNFDLERFPENRVSQRMISRVSPIYERSYVAKWLYEVMGQEVDDAEIRFSELREQANPETATWALRYWEQRYGIEVDESRSLAARRADIIAHRGARAPMNPARVEAILSAMTGRAVHVEENVAPYTIRVDIEAGGEPLDYSAVVDRLKCIKPSHIAFQVFVTADATIKVSPRSRQKVFEYKLTGEHPDVNNIGAQRPIVVHVGPDGRGQAYAYPLTGEHMSGTVPDESYLAYVEGVPVKIVPTAQGTAYAYPLTGEHLAGQLPEESFTAAQGPISAVLAGTGEGDAFPYTLAGEEPGLNNESATAKTALNLSPGGRGAAFPYSMTGEREAGTTPDLNSIGAQQGTAVESSVSGRVFSFDFPLCGDDSD